MIKPAKPANETERLKALQSYNILDTLPEEDYDNITRIASEICHTPISLITLVDEDRQWFKSNIGLPVGEGPRELAYCAHNILDPEQPLIVPNALEDDRFKNNPYATGPPHVEFYVGVPLVTPTGFALGSLCVIDDHPREISEQQLEALKSLAKQVVQLLELRRTIAHLQQTQTELKQANDNLEEFAYIVSHDLKAPLRNISHLSAMVLETRNGSLQEEDRHCIGMMQNASQEAIQLVDAILDYSRTIHLSKSETTTIHLDKWIPALVQRLSPPPHIEFILQQPLPRIVSSKIALKQILVNLMSNAIKYNDKDKGIIQLSVKEEDQHIRFELKDNGKGIPEEKLERIFQLFFMVSPNEARRKGSTGIGLTIVKKLVESLGGTVNVQSIVGQETIFTFTIKK